MSQSITAMHTCALCCPDKIGELERVALRMAGRISVAPCPSVRPSRASDLLKNRKAVETFIKWKHSAGQK